MVATAIKSVLLRKVEEEWNLLKAKYPEGLSLTAAFHQLNKDCQTFKPHPAAEISDRKVLNYAKQYCIWLTEKGPAYITMNAFLHPKATIPEHKLTILGKIYIILFYIDDTITANADIELPLREKLEIQQSSIAFIDALLRSPSDIKNIRPADLLLQACAEVLCEIQVLPDFNVEWYGRFTSALFSHLSQALIDEDQVSESLSLDDYWQKRLHDSGMWVVKLLFELAASQYIDYETLRHKTPELMNKLSYIEYLCSILGAGINDLFSFEKEVLIGKNTFNFVTVLMASQNCSLEFAIYHAIQYLSHCYDEFRSMLLEDFSPARLVQSGLSPREVASLTSLIEDLWLAVKATWVWQAQGTARYQSENWLFTETRPTDDENTMA